jgi:2-polyprenyl-3-methyl-5-hydroxy-6-metoxy-1,4-benzoquinol methylase
MVADEHQKNDIAGANYWDRLWTGSDIVTPIDPRSRRPSNLNNVQFDRLLRQVFAGSETRGKDLIEIGCASSAWLPYFAREFGFRVCGLDYSEIGCEQERRILAQAAVEGEVVHADMFSPPEALRGAFDVVLSWGVMEHFRDTAGCAAAFVQYAKPGGIVMTVIPNMTGAVGWLQKLLNRPVYDIHVLLGSEQLRASHEAAGLRILRCEYFLSTSFGVVNPVGQNPTRRSTSVKRFVLKNLSRISNLVHVMEERIGNLPAAQLMAPYVVCVAQAPKEE